MRPWIAARPRTIVYYPLIQAMWLVKSVAVLEAACFSRVAFRVSIPDTDN